MPTSLTYMRHTLQRLITFETGCGNGYGHSVANTRVKVHSYAGSGLSPRDRVTRAYTHTRLHVDATFVTSIRASVYIRILARTHTHTANRSACQKVRTLVSIPSATFSRITSSVSLPEGAGYSAIQGIALPPREVFSELRALSKREEISPLSYL